MKQTKHTIDAEGKIAGRLASRVAVLLQGKNKVEYKPHLDCGDFVAIENVKGIKFSGKKLDKKIYYRSTSYPGGIRTRRLNELHEQYPDKLFRMIVISMLPKNKLRARMIKRLSFVSGSKDQKSQ